MAEKERKKLIDYIKANDRTYDYRAVNFKYYSDEDLLELKEKLSRKQIQFKKEENGRYSFTYSFNHFSLAAKR